MSKKVTKKVGKKKVSKKVTKKAVKTSKVDMGDILDAMGDKSLSVMNTDVKDNRPYTIKFKNLALQAITDGIAGGTMLEISGECLPSDTLIATSDGPVRIADIKEGDTVFGYNEDGSISPSKVVGKEFKGKRQVVDMMSYDKVVATSTLNHKWLTRRYGRPDKVLTTEELFEQSGRTVKRNFINYSFGGLRERYAYSVGALLGDGCSRQGVSNIHISSPDSCVPSRVYDEIGGKHLYKQSPNSYTWVISNTRGKGNAGEPVTFPLYEQFIKGKYAHEKSIPWEIVDSWDSSTLKRFLEGLIDTDGSVFLSNDGYLTLAYSSTSKELAEVFSKTIYKLYQVEVNKQLDDRARDCYDYRIQSYCHVERIIKDLNLSHARSWKPQYENYRKRSGTSNEFITLKPGKVYETDVWDIEIDNDTKLYVLHNEGLITHNSQTGKSFLMYELMVNTLKMGGYVLLFDTENAFQPRLLRRLGLDKNDSFIYTKKNLINEVFKLSRRFVKNIREKDKKAPIFIAIDSFAGLQHPEHKKNLEEEKGQKGFAAMQKNAMFSAELQDFCPDYCGERGATLCLINQLRVDHTVMFGDGSYTLAETVVQYWCDVRVRLKMGAKTKDEVDTAKASKQKVVKAFEAVAEATKTRGVASHEKVRLRISFDKGLSKYSGVTELLLNRGVISLDTEKYKTKNENDRTVTRSRKIIVDKESGETFRKVRDYLEFNSSGLNPLYIDKLDDDIDVDYDDLEDF